MFQAEPVPNSSYQPGYLPSRNHLGTNMIQRFTRTWDRFINMKETAATERDREGEKENNMNYINYLGKMESRRWREEHRERENKVHGLLMVAPVHIWAPGVSAFPLYGHFASRSVSIQSLLTLQFIGSFMGSPLCIPQIPLSLSVINIFTLGCCKLYPECFLATILRQVNFQSLNYLEI